MVNATFTIRLKNHQYVRIISLAFRALSALLPVLLHIRMLLAISLLLNLPSSGIFLFLVSCSFFSNNVKIIYVRKLTLFVAVSLFLEEQKS